MDTLNTKIKNILTEKTLKVRPENIKKDVTILGITGTLEEGTTPTGTISITENGTVDVTNYASADVNVSGGGGEVIEPKDVNFYDYDGTLLHSYTLEEVNALTELPELPTQEGLTCQGWNWNLADIKAMGKEVDVGATYITDDGKTRLYIHIPTNERSDVPLCFMQTIANGVEIDWGDGSTIETFGGSGKTIIKPIHSYGQKGNYVITLNPIEDCIITLGGGSSSYCIMGGSGNANRIYTSMLVTAQLGNNTDISAYAFYYCYSLRHITIPNRITKIPTYTFEHCYSLKSVVFPNGLTIMEDYAFQNCYALKHIIIPNTLINIERNAFANCYILEHIIIPNTLTSLGIFSFSNCSSLKRIVFPIALIKIPSSLCYYCYSLTKVIIPNSVTSIDSNAFYSCNGVSQYDFSSNTQIPTLGTTVFNGLASDLKIIVPDELYEDWIVATNWSNLAKYIVKVSEV